RSSSSTIWSSRPVAWSSRRGSIIAMRVPQPASEETSVCEAGPPATAGDLRQLLGRLESGVDGVVERLPRRPDALTGVGPGRGDCAAGRGPGGAGHPEVEVAVLDAAGQAVLARRAAQIAHEA